MMTLLRAHQMCREVFDVWWKYNTELAKLKNHHIGHKCEAPIGGSLEECEEIIKGRLDGIDRITEEIKLLTVKHANSKAAKNLEAMEEMIKHKSVEFLNVKVF